MNMEINPIQPSVSDSTRDVIVDLLQKSFSSQNQSEQKAIVCSYLSNYNNTVYNTSMCLQNLIGKF